MYGTITAKDGLRLRRKPDVKSQALDLMAFDDRVEFIPTDCPAGWALVVWLPAKGARLQGWASTKYIRLDREPVPAPGPFSPEPEPSRLGLIFIALGVALAAGLIWAGLR